MSASSRSLAAVIHGGLPKDERRQLLQDFHDGKIRVITNCQVLTEGWDEPKVNCIAEGQRVLTDQGLVPIEQVTRDMKVWDGVEFVEHEGVVCQGEQEVVGPPVSGLPGSQSLDAVWLADTCTVCKRGPGDRSH